MGRSSSSLSSCKNCSEWEIHTYWNRFRMVQFFAYLPEEPHLQLRFPEKLVKNLKEELSDSVVLYGPSGHTWNVGLMRDGDDLFLRKGWQEFVNAHNLKQEDVLIFRYHGESRFDVFMFDRNNYCEKESSYFVRKCGTEGCKLKGKRTERAETTIPSKKQRSEEGVNERPRSPIGGGAKSAPTRRPVKPKLEKDISEGEEMYDDLNPAYYLHYVSERRPVTEAEKSRARELADRAGAKSKLPHCVVVMHPTMVSHRFRLTIPADFARNYLPHRNRDTILSIEGKKWPLQFFYKERGGSGFNGSQWGDFVLDNNLEVGDVCLFELSALKQTTMVLKVSIFRVVEEVIPLKRVTIDKNKKNC